MNEDTENVRNGITTSTNNSSTVVDENGGSQHNVTIDNLLKCLLDVTKCANNLPKFGKNFEYYSSFSLFSDFMQTEGERLKMILNNILKQANSKISLANASTLDEMSDFLERASDLLSERVSNYLDEAEGKRKIAENLVLISSQDGSIIKDSASSFVDASWNKAKPKIDFLTACQKANETSSELKLLASKTVARPQLNFQHLIDNSNRPFKSKLKHKHNESAKKLDNQSNFTILDPEMDSDERKYEILLSDVAKSENPYQYELDHFVPDEKFLERSYAIEKPKNIEQTPLEMIETEEDLEKLCQILKSSSEFGVDLEHHSYRSFQGLTCLMQISLEEKDYLVDCFKLWEKMHILNEPFTDPKILKIFHGANHDIEWLQRDFGIYVVNMFDTGQAMRALGMARFSLAHLIKTYVGEDLNKQFQLADWRIRPLPQCMIDYARQDTRYLLYCYRKLKNDLLDSGNERKNLLISVFERSRDLCARHYQKPLFDENSDFLRLLSTTKKPFNSRQKMALKDLYAWRDAMARLHDESTAYVLPNHMMLQITEVLPREMQGLLSCCNPVPPLVRQHVHDLHKMIIKARQSALETISSATDPTIAQPNKPLDTNIRQTVKPFDFSHIAEDEELVPPVAASSTTAPLNNKNSKFSSRLGGQLSFSFDSSLLKSEPRLYSLVGSIETSNVRVEKNMKNKKNVAQNFSTPYEMYVRALLENAKQKESKIVPEVRTTKSHTHLDAYVPKKLDDSSTSNKRKRDSPKDENDENSSESSSDDEEEENLLIPTNFITASKAKPKKRKKFEENSIEDNKVVVENFDYAQAEQTRKEKMKDFAQNPVFDPHKDFMKQKQNKKGRKFGKKNPKSSSFSKRPGK